MTNENEHVEVILDEPKNEPETELKVEIEEEKPEKVSKEPVKAEKVEEISPQEGINDLKKKLDAERQARIEAERRASEAKKEVHTAKNEAKDANYQLIVNAIDTLKERSETFKNSYAEAMSVGDFQKAASIQEALAINAAQLADLKKGEKAMKEQQEKDKAQKAEPVAPPTGNLADRLAETVSPRSASWLKSHRDTINNEKMVRKMFRAHEDAVDDGIEPDSDEYFGFIEQRLGLAREAEDTSVLSEAAAPAPRKTPQPPPAPVSRSNARNNVIRLSRDQVEMAKMMGMTEADYARNMQALQREGKLGN